MFYHSGAFDLILGNLPRSAWNCSRTRVISCAAVGLYKGTVSYLSMLCCKSLSLSSAKGSRSSLVCSGRMIFARDYLLGILETMGRIKKHQLSSVAQLPLEDIDVLLKELTVGGEGC